jgi:hypothetical protein
VPVSHAVIRDHDSCFPPDGCNNGSIENRVLNAVTFQAIRDQAACRQVIIEIGLDPARNSSWQRSLPRGRRPERLYSSS